MNKGAAFVETDILDEIRKVRDEHAKETVWSMERGAWSR